jgi:hypothetical protein
LETDGELSYENLVFKFLRRSGHIENLFNTADKETDKVLSIKESTTNIGGTFKTDLVNGPKNHSGRALGNWQSDNNLTPDGKLSEKDLIQLAKSFSSKKKLNIVSLNNNLRIFK